MALYLLFALFTVAYSQCATPCTTGQVCVPNPNGVYFCAQACQSGTIANCPIGTTCQTFPLPNGPVGACVEFRLPACTTACDLGAVCVLNSAGSTASASICAKTCTDLSNTCATTEICGSAVSALGPVRVCVPAPPTSNCNPGCNTATQICAPNDNGGWVCLFLCPTQVCDGGLQCTSYTPAGTTTATNVCRPVLSACNPACATGSVCVLNDASTPFCARACTNTACTEGTCATFTLAPTTAGAMTTTTLACRPPPPPSPCPNGCDAGAVCVQSTTGNVCARSCAVNSHCPTGYVCGGASPASTTSGSTTVNVCKPSTCSCPTGQVCTGISNTADAGCASTCDGTCSTAGFICVPYTTASGDAVRICKRDPCSICTDRQICREGLCFPKEPTCTGCTATQTCEWTSVPSTTVAGAYVSVGFCAGCATACNSPNYCVNGVCKTSTECATCTTLPPAQLTTLNQNNVDASTLTPVTASTDCPSVTGGTIVTVSSSLNCASPLRVGDGTVAVDPTSTGVVRVEAPLTTPEIRVNTPTVVLVENTVTTPVLGVRDGTNANIYLTPPDATTRPVADFDRIEIGAQSNVLIVGSTDPANVPIVRLPPTNADAATSDSASITLDGRVAVEGSTGVARVEVQGTTGETTRVNVETGKTATVGDVVRTGDATADVRVDVSGTLTHEGQTLSAPVTVNAGGTLEIRSDRATVTDKVTVAASGRLEVTADAARFSGDVTITGDVTIDATDPPTFDRVIDCTGKIDLRVENLATLSEGSTGVILKYDATNTATASALLRCRYALANSAGVRSDLTISNTRPTTARRLLVSCSQSTVWAENGSLNYQYCGPSGNAAFSINPYFAGAATAFGLLAYLL